MKKMTAAIGSDHAGLDVKKKLTRYLQSLKLRVTDLGAYSTESSDYPDFAFKVAEKAASGAVDLGVLICTTGIGMCIAANKVRGVRAALLYDRKAARLSAAHNVPNVICLPAILPFAKLRLIVSDFLSVRPEAGRHLRRRKKIASYEARRPGRRSA